jgi:hypothetical protein
MKEEIDYKNKFLKLNSESTELFNELHSNYESLRKDYEFLKVQNIDLINKKAESTLDVNAKFGIINLAKLNGEAVFDAMNHFNKLCPYCKTDLYGGHLRNNYEIDHFYPIAKGGQDVPWNLLPICRNCNRKKRDKLPFDYLNEKTYSECNEYLEGVLFRVTNNHEDRLQRDEIIHNLVMKLSSKEYNKDKFINDIYKLYKIPISNTMNDSLDVTEIKLVVTETKLDVTEIKNKIFLNKDLLFNPDSGTYTTGKKVADFLFNNSPTQEQKKILKVAMNELFSDCRSNSNDSYYSVRECRVKLKKLEQISAPIDTVENNTLDK